MLGCEGGGVMSRCTRDGPGDGSGVLPASQLTRGGGGRGGYMLSTMSWMGDFFGRRGTLVKGHWH